jgi:tetratricopeptide (TPR) repeat protein
VFAPKFGPDDFEARELLTELLHVLRRRTDRAHTRDYGRKPSEAEVLDAIARMEAVLRKFECAAEADDIAVGLKEAQELVSLARARDVSKAPQERTVPVGRDEASKLILYMAMNAFEEQLEAEAGEFTYHKGKIAFGQAGLWDEPRKMRKKEEADRMRRVAKARHWLFHSTAAEFDFHAILIDMGTVLHRLRGMKDAANPLTTDCRLVDGWDWADKLQVLLGPCGHVQLRILLAISESGMRIPVAPERCLVGRAAVISKLCAALCEPSARILLHGMQGVGKDIVAAQIVMCDPIRSHPQLRLQAWLQGSSTAQLRRQLLEVFAAQWPELLHHAADEMERVRRVKSWLQSNGSSWLFVIEDMTESTSLGELFPTGVGRLLVTSQQGALPPLAFDLEEELLPIEGAESVELWRKMDLFGRFKAFPVPWCCSHDRATDAGLADACAATAGTVPYVAPTHGESPEQASERMQQMVSLLYEQELTTACSDVGVIYVAPTAGETEKKRRKRIESMQGKVHEAMQLRSALLRQFFDEELGNLPLSVALCGRMLQADETLGSVDDLVGRFRSIGLDVVDKESRKHYFGLVRSVLFAVQRMQGSGAHTPAEKASAMHLLAMLSVLPGGETPVALFDSASEQDEWTGCLAPAEKASAMHLLAMLSVLPGSETVETPMLFDTPPSVDLAGEQHAIRAELTRLFSGDAACSDGALAMLAQFSMLRGGEQHAIRAKMMRCFELTDDGLFSGDADCFEGARAMLTQFGMLRPATEKDLHVGTMHKLVQRCVREQLCTTRLFESPEEASRTLRSLVMRLVELAAIWGSITCNYTRVDDQLAPCLSSLLGHWSTVMDAAAPDPLLLATKAELEFRLSTFHGERSCNFRQAVTHGRRALELAKALHGEGVDHRVTADMLQNLGSQLVRNGDYQDAQPMQEHALAMCRRVLGMEHPNTLKIATDVATSLSYQGKHAEAEMMQREVLGVTRRMFGSEHSNVLMAEHNVAASLSKQGKHAEAEVMQREVLEVQKRVLGLEHRDTLASVGNLAVSLSKQGKYAEAEVMQRKVLAVQAEMVQMRVLGPEHPEIMWSTSNLATSIYHQGKFAEAEAMQRKVLGVRKRLLGAEHPDTLTSVSDLAMCLSDQGKHAEAEMMQREVPGRPCWWSEALQGRG